MPEARAVPSFFWRVGTWVEVRAREEILATLDANGCLDGMPFMPEMLAFCGLRFRIFKSAHKTCDPTGETNLRGLRDAVHLDLRCDGSAHGGCGARCLMFWKTAWLKPSTARIDIVQRADAPVPGLLARTVQCGHDAGGPVYRCQATEITRASWPLSSMDPRPYVQDWRSGNVRGAALFFYGLLAVLREARIFFAALLRGRRAAGGEEPQHAHAPSHPPIHAPVRGKTSPLSRTPPAVLPPLDLKPGDWVRIKDRADIFPTLNKDLKNYGLSFDNDMRRSCGSLRRVLARIDRVIDEKTGRMREIKRDCIVMEGVTCAGVDCRHRLFCPRSVLTYWREAWLEKADPPPGG